MHLSRVIGNRYITVTESMWAHEMAKILEEEFRPLGKIIYMIVKSGFSLKRTDLCVLRLAPVTHAMSVGLCNVFKSFNSDDTNTKPAFNVQILLRAENFFGSHLQLITEGP